MHRKKSLFHVLVQFIEFGLVGVLNTVISLAVYYILLFFHIHYVLANGIGFVLGTLNAYYWNNKYVFKAGRSVKRSKAKSITKVFVSYGCSLIISTVLLYIWIDVLSISDKIAPIINLCITTPLNFLLNKFWAFKDQVKE